MSISSVPNFRGRLEAKDMLEYKAPKMGRDEKVKKEKKNFIETIQETVDMFGDAPWYIHMAADFPEKIKNLIMWKDPIRTLYILIVL